MTRTVKAVVERPRTQIGSSQANMSSRLVRNGKLEATKGGCADDVEANLRFEVEQFLGAVEITTSRLDACLRFLFTVGERALLVMFRVTASPETRRCACAS
jgi:hypothetical protein